MAQPAAIEASVQAQEEYTRQPDDVREALERDLQAARYAAERAQRQYDASDPENRLVTAELERRWNLAFSMYARSKYAFSNTRQRSTMTPKLTARLSPTGPPT